MNVPEGSLVTKIFESVGTEEIKKVLIDNMIPAMPSHLLQIFA